MDFKKFTFVAAAVFAANASLAAVHTFTVNGQRVTKAQQEEVINDAVKAGQKRTPELENYVRQQLLRQAVISQAVKAEKVDRQPNIQKAVKMTTDAIYTQGLFETYTKKHPVTDAEVKKFFEAEKNRWGDREVKVRHIVVKDKKTAEDLMVQIRNGADFAKLAKEKSVDSQENRDNGGLIDWTSPRIFDRDFSAGFSNLKPGDLCLRPVQTRLGWHIIRFEGERPAQNWQDFSKYEKQIRQAITQERFTQYIQSLAEKAKVVNVK